MSDEAGKPLRKAAFLDRDGVINVDHAYVHRWEDFEFMPGAVDAMRRLHEMGYALVVVTNQSGIARGKYSEADFQALNARMCEHLASEGVPVLAVYHCPHHPQGSVPAFAIECDCRKPAPGMILSALAEHGLDPAASFMVGDKPIDVEAGMAAGLGHSILVTSRYHDTTTDLEFEDLGAWVTHLVSQQSRAMKR